MLHTLKAFTTICVPWCYYFVPFGSVRLIGFCDASLKSYAAVVYLRFENDDLAHVWFVAAKTGVFPLEKITVPR